MKMLRAVFIFCFCTGTFFSVFSYNTRHVIILVMDGARYTETWGDSAHTNIPAISALAAHGTVFTNFRTIKAGAAACKTETCPGHARLTTGTVQDIVNNGTELPTQPGIFQEYLKQTKSAANAAWVITSKDKLVILSNSSAVGWNNEYRPSFYCGVSGTGSGGYCEDSVTNAIVLQKLKADKPALMIINYKGPDAMGHAGNWAGYLLAIKEVDSYVKVLWETIQADPRLKDSTLLFIVNDHGRHTTDYTSHGDTCEGCSHLMCLALGSDVRAGFVDTTTREQIDIAPTIAKLLGFAMPSATGTVMHEILDAPSQKATSVLPRNKPLRGDRKDKSMHGK